MTDRRIKSVTVKETRACGCGRSISDTVPSESCRRCRRYVPVRQVRIVVERIHRLTGWSTKTIARRAGLNPPSLVSSLVPSRSDYRIARETYIAVKNLASAVQSGGAPIPMNHNVFRVEDMPR